jgi:hypothetical protein
MPDRGALASTSVARHLVRGAIGFGLVGSALVLTPSVGPAALLLAPVGMVALRGCPACWIAGLIEAISAGRLQRSCTDTSCTLHPPLASGATPGNQEDGDSIPHHRLRALTQHSRSAASRES